MEFEMLKLKMFVFLGLLLALFSMDKLEMTRACTGRPPSLAEALEIADYVVSGTFIEVDGYGQSGFFQVDNYLYGKGMADRLFISRASPAHVRASMDWLDLGCQYLAQPIHTSGKAILVVYRNMDGSYNSVIEYSYDNHGYPIIGWDTEYQYRDDSWKFSYHQLGNLIKLRASLQMFLVPDGIRTSSPSNASLLPFPAPIMIKTDQGTAYMVPLDGQAPLLLASKVEHTVVAEPNIGLYTRYGQFIVVDRRLTDYVTGVNLLTREFSIAHCQVYLCAAFSENGQWFATITDKQQPTLSICQTVPTFGELCAEYDGFADIQAFALSNNRTLVAVWDGNNTIDIVYFDFRVWGSREPFTLLSQIELKTNGILATDFAGHGIWSPDSQQFAYTDSEGLWLSRVFAEGIMPRLLVPAGDALPYPIKFSQQGGYLTVGEGEIFYTVEIATGNRLPYGIVSSDVTWLVENRSEIESNRIVVHDLVLGSESHFEYGVETVESVIFALQDRYLVLVCTNFERLSESRNALGRINRDRHGSAIGMFNGTA